MRSSIHWVITLFLLLGLAACSNSDDDDDSRGGNGGGGGTAACADGLDNDGDGLTDFPNDAGCSDADDDDETNQAAAGARTRYAMNNQCWAIRSGGNGLYVTRSDTGFSATAASIDEAEPFFMKPTALGKYALYNTARQVIAANGATLAEMPSASATDAAEWTVLGVGDSTNYPPTPEYNVEPTPEQVQTWMNFEDPQLSFTQFTIHSGVGDTRLAIDEAGNLINVASSPSPANEAFSFEPASGCAKYPEAESNFSGAPFKGTQPDGSVLGHADVHVHISATEFLGGAEWGRPYHKFGIEHALGNCAAAHGPTGHLDLVGGIFTQDFDGHATDGYPTFTDWPARGNLTHEAIYWKWQERAWAAGLRIIVNDLVDNETLCELQRNASLDPLHDCNPMNNAGEQAGSMYGMMNYIDAQYGGPGKGFFQIVHDPVAAREVIEDGKIAVILGIEISNLFNCKLKYNPLRMTAPENETGAGLLGLDNSYNCTVEEGQPNSILTQMQRIHDWGVRQVISVHEFDNAFGGNGIFDAAILNLGNRENSGGIPSGDLAAITNLLTDELSAEQIQSIVTNLPTTELPTGEFWTTYNCPVEDETPGFSGYLWEDEGGEPQTFALPGCLPTGQGGRAGGAVPCYPSGIPQCNARWMTPAGLYTYGKMMEMGFMFDFDHMAVAMKTQALELTEAQDITYPIVSTHGTFGGITNDQAQRVLRNGGFLYPSNGSSRGFRSNMDETFAIWQQATADLPASERPLFGFGYGTDTNGLSNQSGPRGDFEGEDAVVYPFSLYQGDLFDTLNSFDSVNAVSFAQPSSTDPEGSVVRTWHEDIDGNAHYGMLSDFVQELRLEGDSDHIRHLYNSAEAYLRTWEKTVASSNSIQAGGLKLPESAILRPAPVGDSFDSEAHFK